MPDTFEPEIITLYCGRSLQPSEFLPEGSSAGPQYRARFVKIPCSSKIEPIYIIRLFERGADAVLVIACPRESCQFYYGDACAESRASYTRHLLDEIGLGGARLCLVSRTNLTAADVQSLTGEMAAAVCNLGPNRLKKSLAGAV